MSTHHVSTRTARHGPNQAAHYLLTQLIERVGLNRRAFLDQLADLGYAFSDDDFANWGRVGRSFPRSPGALRAMIQVVTEKHPPQRRCTAAEALQFLGLTGMPFPELHDIIELFDSQAFSQALAAYIPVATQPAAAPTVHAGAFQLERVPPEQEQGAVISKGLSALAALLWAPEVRDAVVRFRGEFEVACEQVAVLADYKKDVLGREPSRINTQLVSTASTLRLRTLIGALAVVRNTLSGRNLNPDAQSRFVAFEHGLLALSRLNNRLISVINTHNAFQEVDDELRRIEVLLEQDTTELAYAWQSLRPMVQQLCDASEAVWATKLTTMSAELEAVLGLESAPKAIRLFRAYRSQASRSFNQVDRDLLGICEELRQIGEPLATVLKMII